MITPKTHSGYLISAVFIPLQDVTHYIVHKHLNPGVGVGIKMSKDEIIDIIENSGLPVNVWQWNYESGKFEIAKTVNCNEDYNGNKYLWINEKDPATKDLKHLIKMNWFEVT